MSETSELIDTKAKFKSYATLHPFLWAGNATFTLVSKLTNKRFTFRLAQTNYNKSIYFVAVMNGPDNEHNYAYMGMANIVEQEFYLTRNSKVTEDAPSYVAFNWFFYMLFSNPEQVFRQSEIWHEGKCGRCGRKLTVPSSIEAGIGPDCLTKMEGE